MGSGRDRGWPIDPMAVSAYGAEQTLPLTGTERNYRNVRLLYFRRMLLDLLSVISGFDQSHGGR